jgi:hypothetical protein
MRCEGGEPTHRLSTSPPQIPDIQPFIANDESAIRYYLFFAAVVIAIGIATVGIAFLPALKATNAFQDIAQKIGGGFITSLSAFPIKECLARRDRLRILTALDRRIAALLRSENPSDEIASAWVLAGFTSWIEGGDDLLVQIFPDWRDHRWASRTP